MAENKNAYTRFLILDECLRNGFARFTLTSLLEKLNEKLDEKSLKPIGRTQFHKDLNYLEFDLGAPIIREQEGQSKRIRYDDPNFSIKNQALDISLVKDIRDSLSTLLQFKGLHQLEELEELLPKLDKEFDLDTQTKQIIAFEDNPFLKGLEFLNPLIAYIKNDTQLIITYKSFRSSKSIEFDLSPYFLKRYNQRWFLFGQVNGFETLTNLALDRIDSIEFSSNKFTPNILYNWNEYFDDMIGVSRPSNGVLTEIQLKFTPEQAPYIKTKPIHGSQKVISENEDGLVVRIEVIPNNELEALIFSYGESCEVLFPLRLRRQIIERLSKFKY
ncbi:MAG: WYL domain-containing protein [Algoriphagus sp.]|uniref:helix-turn-helix transcriptional regulator n=1 Tax=Algoriphagus sp. TaxID=1872435 RepID=UPI002630979F|nr:WYL domain-containing protein [Algoriphagus sp.]MDG1276917.1 WYL domain-containing protein [Algoriphagus sp.]